MNNFVIYTDADGKEQTRPMTPEELDEFEKENERRSEILRKYYGDIYGYQITGKEGYVYRCQAGCYMSEPIAEEVLAEIEELEKEYAELMDKINQHTKKKYIPNVVSRKILQSAQRLLEQEVLFEMKRSNGIRKIQAQYFGDGRDDSDDKTDVSSSSAVDPVRNVETA